MVNGNNSVKEWIGVHSSLVVSPHKVNNMLGKQQIIVLSKVCNVNNTNVLEHKIVVFSQVAIAHLQP
jgi:uncharacterized protein YidB (DUF937 family)